MFSLRQYLDGRNIAAAFFFFGLYASTVNKFVGIIIMCMSPLFMGRKNAKAG